MPRRSGGENIAKIAIRTRDVHAHFAYSLAKMMVRTVQAPILFNEQETVLEVEIFMKSSSTLPTLRNMVVKDAADWGANYPLLGGRRPHLSS